MQLCDIKWAKPTVHWCHAELHLHVLILRKQEKDRRDAMIENVNRAQQKITNVEVLWTRVVCTYYPEVSSRQRIRFLGQSCDMKNATMVKQVVLWTAQEHICRPAIAWIEDLMNRHKMRMCQHRVFWETTEPNGGRSETCDRHQQSLNMTISDKLV